MANGKISVDCAAKGPIAGSLPAWSESPEIDILKGIGNARERRPLVNVRIYLLIYAAEATSTVTYQFA